MYWGGIRDYLRVVSDHAAPAQGSGINAGQMRAYIWTQVVHGNSGSMLFYMASNEINSLFNPERTRRDALKALPHVKNEINDLGGIVLPRPRIRGRVALVYPFETFRNHIPYDYREFMKAPLTTRLAGYYGGLLFSGIPCDVISTHQLLSKDLSPYQAICFADYERAPSDVISRIEAYVKQGGTLLATPSSFMTDDDFGNPLPSGWMGALESEADDCRIFRQGSGWVYRLTRELDLPAACSLVSKIAEARSIQPGFSITRENGSRASFVEAQAFGSKGRHVWYFLNWGAPMKARIAPRQLPVSLEGRSFTVRNSETREPIPSPSGSPDWTRQELEEGFDVALECQNPLVLLIEEAGISPTPLTPVPQEDFLAKIWKATPRKNKTRILYHIKYHERMTASKTPQAAELLEAEGFGIYTLLSPLGKKQLQVFDGGEVLNAQKLDDYKILVISAPQGNVSIPAEAVSLLEEYVREGGGLLLLGQIPHGPHNWLGVKAFSTLSRPYGVQQVASRAFEDPVKHGPLGALAVRFEQMAAHLITENVSSFCSAGSGVLEVDGSHARAIITGNPTSQPADKAVLAVAEHGKGRVVMMADAYWLEGDALAQGDNRVLLKNIFHWLARQKD